MSGTQKNFSIKWKLSFALIITGLSLIFIYVILAKRVFENDKISYVYESQNSHLKSLKREMDAKFQQALLNARSLLATLDASANMPPAASGLFKENKSLLAIELWDEIANKSIFHIEKTANIITSGGNQKEQAKSGEIRLFVDKNQNFLLTFRPYQDPNSPLLARIVMDAHDFLPAGDISQAFVFVKDNQLLSSVGTTGFDPAILSGLVTQFGADSAEQTTLWKFNSKHFLVSVANLSLGDFRLIAITPEEQALGALNTLFSRSLVFLIFSTFGLIVISLLLAKGLTANLQVLTTAATEIGQGNFDKAPTVQSKDEIGVLAKAFQKMAQEIKRLLQETKDKARMESELKTAKLVQESLFPESPTIYFNAIEVNGFAITSTECGGDWWYYFAQGDDLYIAIADATGHGTPAALITAAARSVFARIENEKISLTEMMRAWDHSVSSCSNKRVFMTGFLMKINSHTGAARYLSAGHDPPYLFKPNELVGFDNSFLDLNLNPVLGEGLKQSELIEQTLQLDKNSSLVLYTDGLFSVERLDGKKLSERRLGKKIATELEHISKAEAITKLVMKEFEDHRQGLPLPDDVTIVTVHRS